RNRPIASAADCVAVTLPKLELLALPFGFAKCGVLLRLKPVDLQTVCLDPAPDRGMIDDQAPLRHEFFQVAKAQAESPAARTSVSRTMAAVAISCRHITRSADATLPSHGMEAACMARPQKSACAPARRFGRYLRRVSIERGYACVTLRSKVF